MSSGPAAGFVPNRNGQLVFGCRSDEGYNFAGGVDEFALYTNVLSDAVILSHYQNGTNASRTTPYATLIQAANPLLYYRFDEPAYTAPLSLPPANNLGTLGSAANGATPQTPRRERPDRLLAGWALTRSLAPSTAPPGMWPLGISSVSWVVFHPR